MATQAALAIRRDAAFKRIEAAVGKLAKGTETTGDDLLAVRHRDPVVEQVMRVEAVANSLDELTKTITKVRKADKDARDALAQELAEVKAELDAAKAASGAQKDGK